MNHCSRIVLHYTAKSKIVESSNIYVSFSKFATAVNYLLSTSRNLVPRLSPFPPLPPGRKGGKGERAGNEVELHDDN